MVDDAYVELGSWTRGDRYLKDIIVVSWVSRELFHELQEYFCRTCPMVLPDGWIGIWP